MVFFLVFCSFLLAHLHVIFSPSFILSYHYHASTGYELSPLLQSTPLRSTPLGSTPLGNHRLLPHLFHLRSNYQRHASTVLAANPIHSFLHSVLPRIHRPRLFTSLLPSFCPTTTTHPPSYHLRCYQFLSQNVSNS